MLYEAPSLAHESDFEPDIRQPSALERKLGHHVDLSRTEREAIDRLLVRSVRSLKPGSVLVEEGASPAEINVIVEGWACRYTRLPQGGRRIVAFYLPGDVCDFDVFMMQAFDQSIAAIDGARVAGIGRAALSDLSKSHPRISRALWWESFGAAAIQRAWTINIGQCGAKQRIAHLLCELVRRLEAVGRLHDRQCEFPLTQADIADACALTAVHTNRTMQVLRRSGLIEMSQKVLTIIDRGGLHALADFDPSYLQFGDVSLSRQKDVHFLPLA